MTAARDNGATVLFRPRQQQSHFGYAESDGTRHDVWFLDGVTAFNQIHAAIPIARPAMPCGGLGSEDPASCP